MANTITCHTCEKEVFTVRSVKLKGDECNDGLRVLDGPTTGQKKWEAYQLFKRNHKPCRAFICEECYDKLEEARAEFNERMEEGPELMPEESQAGCEIQTPHGPRYFVIDVASCGDRAATYDYAKWKKYQDQQAAKMGIDNR